MLDTESVSRRALDRTATDFGQHVDDDLYHSMIGCNHITIGEILTDAFGPTVNLADFRARWLSYWRQTVKQEGISLKPGLLSLLDWLDARHIPRAVATSSDEELARLSLTRVQLLERFQFVMTGDQIKNGKPAPDIFLAAASGLQIDPGQCIALEDSDAGVKAASHAGMYTIMVPDVKPPSKPARAAAAQVVPDLSAARTIIESLFNHSSDRTAS